MWTLSAQRMRTERDPTAYKWMIDNFTQSWRNFRSGRIWTLITASFSHENIGHILFNGFTFFFMARPVLAMLGSRQFLFLYLGGGLFASVGSMAWNLIVKGRDAASYGASGAIYSVVSFLACVAPTMTFQLYGIIPVPAWLLVTGVFAYDTYSAINDKQRGTDTAGHVAGLLAGAGYYIIARRRRIL
ncbi:putative rhomboid [Lyophyllum shimeji]|uniref:Rhomboid n=1 Tax=Lyophyllum shimeji TaxID=47721 RepID=A0A9P3UJP8_LYOSH|nr:putative rhomboid [Lyophyllum shimeji]